MVLRHVSILKDHPQGVFLYLAKVTELSKRFKLIYMQIKPRFCIVLIFTKRRNSRLLHTTYETGLSVAFMNHCNRPRGVKTTGNVPYRTR